MSWTQLAVTGLVVVSAVIVCLTYPIWAAAFLGVLFATSLNAGVPWVRHFVAMPHWLAMTLIILTVLMLLLAVSWIVGNPLASQFDELTSKLPSAADKMLEWLDERPWGQRILRSAEDLSGVAPQELVEKVKDPNGDASNGPTENQPSESEPQSPAEEQSGSSKESQESELAPLDLSQLPDLGQIVGPIIKVLSLTTSAAMLFLVTFIIMLFVAFDPHLYLRGLIWLVPQQHEATARKTLERLTVAMRWWMLGRFISMLIIGVLTSLGMWLIGMPAPLALGAIAGLFSFVPNIGPIAAAVPGMLLAVAVGPWMALWVAGVYLGTQLIESNFIEPLVEQSTVSVPPAVLIVTQLVMAAIWGAWGMLVATPLLVVLMVLVQQLYVRKALKKPIEVTGSKS
jgi:predicted PurR-regulated permease PerM